MVITTRVRRITQAINRHARTPATQSASGGGMTVYFDRSGREVYHHPTGEIAPIGKNLCPWDYTTRRTVRWHETTTYTAVADALEDDPKGIFA